MPKVVSLINMKGGVGKTTLTVNIGYALARERDKQVLIVDADPQFNASTYLMKAEDYLAHVEKKRTLLDIFRPKRAEEVDTVRGKSKSAKSGATTLDAHISRRFEAPTSGGGRLDLLPAQLQLLEIENAERRTEDRLRHFLAEKCQGYDYILIDCPPTISIFTQAAMLASDKYLVPIKPDPLSSIGLPSLESWLARYSEDAGIKVDQIGIVFCMVRNPRPSAMKKVMDELRAERKAQVFTNHLSLSTKIAESVEKHTPIFLHSPGGKEAKEMISLTDEFLARVEGVC
jgi:chromosome partitioning protein